ncbi:TIR domain-containing protein [Leptospira limi]|uniref:Toll/interleukin-1 receptor domain-containing protein n=1 Tax=Leptospira limi TaxID=2950023 RepID=A0ABT3M241_9LEPT|nr:TIR domain-containing protein [Leptospira limi]MCW7464040.1 toll/interleukin-1 receptor domain-containing protein [Leptospira limi]
MKTKIFISYSDKDRKKISLIEKEFKDTPEIELIIIANNKSEMVTLTKKVTDGIKKAEYFIPILTKQSISEQWINQEIGYASAYKENINESLNILPIAEKSILNNLKGFIHKQFDISFTFEGVETNARAESIRFKKTVIALKEFILDNSNLKSGKTRTNDLYKLIVNKRFNFVFNSENNRSKIIEFSPDGTITKGKNQNEDSWEIKNEKLIIKNSQGQIFSTFLYDSKTKMLKHTNEKNTLSLKNQYMVPIE